MTAHVATHHGERQFPRRRATRNGLVQLGWLHFWLLTCILGGMLALVGLAFLAQIWSR